MNQEERLDYLVEAFKEDSVKYKNIIVKQSERKTILRSLMNIRMPRPVSEKMRKIQDDYLQEEVEQKGIVTLDMIPTIKEQNGSRHRFADKISIWQGDITRLRVDAIVNAANSQMLGCFVQMHKCIDNAIHSAAGIEFREACNEYMNSKKKFFQHMKNQRDTQLLQVDLICLQNM